MDFGTLISQVAQGWTGRPLPPVGDKLDIARKPTLNAGILSDVINRLDPRRETKEGYFQAQETNLKNLVNKALAARLVHANEPDPTVPERMVSPQEITGEVLGANSDDFIFDYEPYMRHMETPHNIPQPEPATAQILRNTYPDDATRSAITAWTESGFDPKADGLNETGKLAGTRDLGLFQVNAGVPNDPRQITTFADLLRRKPAQMEEAGVIDQESLFNPLVNARVAKINRDEAGGWWDRWYGLRNRGFREQDFQGLTSPY